LTPACENWTIKDGAADSASKTFGDITVTLRSPSKQNLTVTLWKGGLDTGATMSCDGVTAASDLEMTVSGLSAGIHTIVTYHASPEKAAASRFDLLVNGKAGLKDEQQPSRVSDDFDANYCCVEWNASKGKDLVLTFS